MPQFEVNRQGEASVTVEASNWVTALGAGLDLLGGDVGIQRLACEMLGNGTVIARDVGNGKGYVVREQRVESEVPEVEIFDETDTGPVEITDLTSELEALPQVREDAVVLALIDGVRAAPDPGSAWARALAVAQDLVPCEGGAGIRGASDGSLEFVEVHGPHGEALSRMRLPPGTGIAGFCYARRASIIVSDPQNDPRFFRTADALSGAVTRSLLCTPVAFEEESHGVLELLNAPDHRPFSRTELELLEMVSAALAERLTALKA